jgi:4,5-dihydroxyphthalate decarboxylase
MPALKLTFASGNYDRMEALHTDAVRIEGVALDHIALWPPREIFDRMGGAREFDVAEFSSSEYISAVDRGDCPFVALPVFPSRVFRHGNIVVNRRSGIRVPKDLEGKRIGVPLYTQTAAIWIRGMLQHDHGVDLSGVHWLQGGVDEAGSHGIPSAPPMQRPPPIEINRSDRSLIRLLVAGEVDALIGTRVEDAVKASPDIVRLFPDCRGVERDYFQRTGIFPIMHLVVMQKPLYEHHPWLAARLFRAFVEAKAIALKQLHSANTQRTMLPWFASDIEEIDALFGADPWSYGIEPNRKTLATLVEYMTEQGFIERRIPLEELFVPVED